MSAKKWSIWAASSCQAGGGRSDGKTLGPSWVRRAVASAARKPGRRHRRDRRPPTVEQHRSCGWAPWVEATARRDADSSRPVRRESGQDEPGTDMVRRCTSASSRAAMSSTYLDSDASAARPPRWSSPNRPIQPRGIVQVPSSRSCAPVRVDVTSTSPAKVGNRPSLPGCLPMKRQTEDAVGALR